MSDEEKKEKKTFSVYLDPEVIEKIDREAAEKKMKRSPYLAKKLTELATGEHEEETELPLILVMSSHKGGVAKTITAANLAVEFAIQDKKTLVIDLDGQGSISEYLHVYDEGNEKPCIADVMVTQMDGSSKRLSEVKRHAEVVDDEGESHIIENLEVVPSDLRFDNADSKMKNSSMAGVDTRLRDAIKDLIDEVAEAGDAPYELIIIDCPPRVDLVTTNAITALGAGKSSSMVIVPVRPDGFSKRGMESTVSAIEAVSRSKKTRMANWMLLRTIDEPRTNLSRLLEDTVKEDFPDAKFLDTKIDKAVVVMESSQFYTPLAYYAPNSKSRSQYIELAQEIEEIANGDE